MKYLFFLLFLNSILFSQTIDSNRIDGDSILSNKNIEAEKDTTLYKINYRDPFKAGLYSFLVPGLALGQLYNNDNLNWGLRFGISVSCVAGSYFLIKDGHNYTVPIIFAFIYAGNWITSIFDASRKAEELNLYFKRKTDSSKRKLK